MKSRPSKGAKSSSFSPVPMKRVGICSFDKAADIPGYDIGAWIGYAASPGTPKEITNLLAAEIAKAVRVPEVRDRMLALGLEPTSQTPDEMAVFLKAEQQRYGDIIRNANIRIDSGNK